MVERLHAVVHGYVQGVGFRAYVAQEGRRLGLTGAVWNRADGAVELVAEGARGILEEFRRLLERGPNEAEVQRLETRWEAAEGRLSRFEIRY